MTFKKWMLAGLVLSTMAVNDVKAANDEEPHEESRHQVWIQNTELTALETEHSEMGIWISYPGRMSGLCGVEIRADSYGRYQGDIRRFMQATNVKGSYGSKPKVRRLNPMSMSIDVSASEGSYGVLFSIQSQNGQSLNSVIKATLGENRKVVLIGISCL